MQRLIREQAEEDAAAYDQPRRRAIEYAYVRPRSVSRGRTPSRQDSRSRSRSRSLSRQRSLPRESLRRVSDWRTSGHDDNQYAEERYRKPIEERERLNDHYGRPAFGGNARWLKSSREGDRPWNNYVHERVGEKVRYVRASERLG